MSKDDAQAYSSNLRDFPRANLLSNVLFNYQMCEELLTHELTEVRKEQLRSPLVATPEIVERHFELAKQYGWGCFPGEIEWIFRNVVRELGCEMPACSIR